MYILKQGIKIILISTKEEKRLFLPDLLSLQYASSRLSLKNEKKKKIDFLFPRKHSAIIMFSNSFSIKKKNQEKMIENFFQLSLSYNPRPNPPASCLKISYSKF